MQIVDIDFGSVELQFIEGLERALDFYMGPQDAVLYFVVTATRLHRTNLMVCQEIDLNQFPVRFTDFEILLRRGEAQALYHRLDGLDAKIRGMVLLASATEDVTCVKFSIVDWRGRVSNSVERHFRFPEHLFGSVRHC